MLPNVTQGRLDSALEISSYNQIFSEFVFMEGAAMKILGREREEVTGEWRKLHDFELNYSKPSDANILIIFIIQ